MDRLSTLDAEFLHLEDGIAHMHIAGISIFEGPAPAAADVARLVGSKLHLMPRYRQRVHAVPLELGRPVWVDDPHFNLDYHVRHTALPPPGSDADLCGLMARLMSQPLDRNRPLWEEWFVENLPGGRWALISKVHHCMVDGIAGVGLLSVMLDADRDATLPDAPAWHAAPEPSLPALLADAWTGLAGDAASLVGRLPHALGHPPARCAEPVGPSRASWPWAATWPTPNRCRSRAPSVPTAGGRTRRRRSTTCASCAVPSAARSTTSC